MSGNTTAFRYFEVKLSKAVYETALALSVAEGRTSVDEWLDFYLAAQFSKTVDIPALLRRFASDKKAFREWWAAQNSGKAAEPNDDVIP